MEHLFVFERDFVSESSLIESGLSLSNFFGVARSFSRVEFSRSGVELSLFGTFSFVNVGEYDKENEEEYPP